MLFSSQGNYKNQASKDNLNNINYFGDVIGNLYISIVPNLSPSHGIFLGTYKCPSWVRACPEAVFLVVCDPSMNKL